MIRTMAVVTALVAAALLPPAAIASPYDDLVKAHAAFQALKSWHADEHFENGRTISMDFSAPDHWRVQLSPKITQLVIGDDVYIVHNGKSSKLPVGGAMIRQQIESANQSAMDDEVKQSARDLGMQTVNGKSVHAYSFTSHGAQETLYLGADSLPVEAVVKTAKGNVTIDYSKFNEPITIEP